MPAAPLVLLPFMIALVTLAALLASWQYPRIQKTLHVVGLILLLAGAAWLVFGVANQAILIALLGGWAAPFGVVWVADGLSATLLMSAVFVALCCGLYALKDIDETQFNIGFLPAFWVLLIGIIGTLLTGDFFNLYVWFEVMLIGSFILLGLGKPNAWLPNKVKYVILNLLGTFLLLAAIAFIYGLSGTLNFADFTQYVTQHPEQHDLILLILLFFFIALAVKAALFPVFAWLPASYHTTSATASAFMGGVLTKVSIYVLLRTITLLGPLFGVGVKNSLLTLACLTMLVGVLGAAAQFNYRRILSFHIVSQIGYMLIGLALLTPMALTACLFFVVHNIITKTSLFLSAGIAERAMGSSDVRQMGNLYREHPWIAWLFFLPALSLAGLPPLLGFWGKFLVIQSTLASHAWTTAIIAIAVSLLTLYSMVKIWHYAYWQKVSAQDPAFVAPKLCTLWGLIMPAALLTSLMLVMSFWPQPFFHFIQMAGDQLSQPQDYINAVLANSTKV